jgi:DNA-directed RNA polymerase specialized sigma24 family protein
METALARNDGQLLAAWLGGEEAAFAELVGRHGTMVLGVCRRVLGPGRGADDAAQAALVALARKARSLRGQRDVGAWLHRAAWFAATKAVRAVRRREAHEREAAKLRPAVGETPAGFAAGALLAIKGAAAGTRTVAIAEAVMKTLFWIKAKKVAALCTGALVLGAGAPGATLSYVAPDHGDRQYFVLTACDYLLAGKDPRAVRIYMAKLAEQNADLAAMRRRKTYGSLALMGMSTVNRYSRLTGYGRQFKSGRTWVSLSDARFQKFVADFLAWWEKNKAGFKKIRAGKPRDETGGIPEKF